MLTAEPADARHPRAHTPAPAHTQTPPHATTRPRPRADTRTVLHRVPLPLGGRRVLPPHLRDGLGPVLPDLHVPEREGDAAAAAEGVARAHVVVLVDAADGVLPGVPRVGRLREQGPPGQRVQHARPPGHDPATRRPGAGVGAPREGTPRAPGKGGGGRCGQGGSNATAKNRGKLR